MNRDDLQLMVMVKRHGHLAAAASALKLAPSVVTKRLARLERYLGVRLFHRTTRQVQTTAEGERLCEHAESILQAFTAAESELLEIQREPAGPLRIAGTFGFGRRWLGPLLAEFQHLYPKIKIHLQLTERLPNLGAEGWDGAVWLWPVPSAHSGEWIGRKLASNQRILVAAPGYLKHFGIPETPDDLSLHQQLVVHENTITPEPANTHWRLEHEATQETVTVKVAGGLTSNSGEMVRDWCLSGQGIMLRSEWDVAHHLRESTLVRVLPQWRSSDADVQWIAPYRSRTPRRVRLLVDFLAERLGEQPWLYGSRTGSARPSPPC